MPTFEKLDSSEVSELLAQAETPPKRRGRPPSKPVYITQSPGDPPAAPAGAREQEPGKGEGATRKASGSRSKPANGGDLESRLWTTADKLRGHMDAAEYKHVVLGLIFL